MTRHARNCTAGAVYTYSEKKRDAAEAGYGTNAQRLGKDSVKSFDCCSLTLQPCRHPVVTKYGVLFDKEAILQYMIAKKNEYQRKLKEYGRSRAAKKANGTNTNNNDSMFSKTMSTLQALDATANSLLAVKKESSISNVGNGNEHKLPSFWVPSECPNAGLAELKKPDPTIYCPVSQQPIKIKDLIDVKFTLCPSGDTDKKSTSIIAKETRYMCPVTHDVLNNAVPCFVLRPTGDVVTGECVEKLIRKNMIHPLTNQKLTEKDIIPLQRGGTGYAITNDHLEAKEKRPMLQV